MSDDLTERLRDRRVCSPAQNSCRNDYICDLAADRIEDLERAVRYEADVAQQALDSMKELKAKLAKAVKALEFIDDTISWEINPSNYGHDEVCDMNRDWGEIGNYVEAALAELNGETDE